MSVRVVSRNLLRAALAVVVGIGVCLVPVATAQAATGDLAVTRVPGPDAATSAGFAWQVTQAAGSGTWLAWGPAATFDCGSATSTTATAPDSVQTDGGVTYARVTLTALQPGTGYAYCALAGNGQRSLTARFVTPAAGTSPVTVLAFGNAHWRSTSSYQNTYATTVAQAVATYPDATLAVHTGQTGSSRDATHWTGFLAHAATALDELTWMPTAQTAGSANRYLARGNALPAQANGYDSANYATVAGDGLFLTVNTYLTATADLNATSAWITDQVRSFRAGHPDGWVVASIPTEFYGAAAPSSATRTTVQQAFKDNGIALVLQGSAAAYTRSWPVGRDAASTVQRDYPSTQRVATSDGIVYVTPGASGTEQAAVPAAARQGNSSWLAASTTDLTAAQRLAAGQKSYTAITVAAGGLTVTARTVDGGVLDNFTIDRGATPAEVPVPLSPVGLTNGFGTDARTERVVSWLAPASDGLTSPYLSLTAVSTVAGTAVGTVAGTAAGTAASTDPASSCTAKPMTSPLNTFTAYTCTVTGLAAGTTYDYLVGAHKGARSYESQEFSFTTDGDAQSFTFLDFADTQSTPATSYDQYWGNNLRSALAAHPETAFVAHNGDITEATNSANLTGWLGAIGTSLSGVAFNPVLGNHDDSSSAAPMWAALFPRASRTTVPAYNEPSTLQYSYVYGNALFLHVNTNLDTASQLATTDTWVRQAVAADGKNPDGSDRFIIVVEHKSPFGGTHAGSGAYPTGDFNNPNIVAQLPKTYDAVGVDLVLAGHDHNLIRSLPIRWNDATNRAEWDRSQADKTAIDSTTDGLVYYIPRNAGQKTYPLIATPSATSRPWIAWNWAWTDLGNEQPANDVYAVVKVDRSLLTVASYRAGDPATPVDQFTVTQSPAAPVQLSTPAVTGGAEAGSVVTAAVSAVPSSAALTYEWLRDGVVVRPAGPDATYLVQVADAGHELTVRVTGTARRMTTTTVTSAPVAVDPVVRVWAKFSQDTWQISDASATLTPTVSSSCRSWTVADDASWLTQTPASSTSDRTVTVSASSNGTTAPRTGTVTVSGCNTTGTLTVTQSPRAQLTVGASSWTAPVLGGEGTVAVTTNQSAWTASVPASASSWLTVSPSGEPGDPLVLTAKANTVSSRSAVVTVTSGSASRTVTVTQAVPTLTVSTSSWGPSRSGASMAFQVRASTGSWDLDLASVPAWVGVDRISGADRDWIVVRADRNLGQSRSAALTITSAGLTRTITVSQATAASGTVSASPSAWTAAPGADTRAVTVTTNGQAWHASTEQEWVHLEHADATSGGLLVVGADPNTGTTTRTARITVQAGTATQTLTVTQPRRGSGAGYIGIAPLAATDGSVTLATGLSGQVAVTDDAGWLTSTVNNGVLSLVAAPNTGEVRSARVSMNVGGTYTASYAVVQQGAPSISAGSAWTVSADGGSLQRVVTAGRWSLDGASPVTASADASWLRVPQGPQDSGTQLGLAADPNPSATARTGTVTITTPEGGRATITVTQRGL